MKRLRYYIIGILFLFPFLLSCSEETQWAEEGAKQETVQMLLNVCVPSAVNVRSIANNALLQDFVLLAFQNGRLLWMLRHDDPQVLLNGEELTLHINKIAGEVELMMLANLGSISLPSWNVGAEQSVVETSLRNITFDCSTLTGGIPMEGELTLTDGFTSNTTGTISLRRSVAKISVKVVNDNDDIRFVPQEMQVVNVNTTASIIPRGITTGNQTAKASFTNNRAEVYVADTGNNPADGSRISVLIKGIYIAPMATEGNERWYRLDMIKESDYQTISSLERNHHYSFTIKNLTYMGSGDRRGALEKEIPDNDLLDNLTGDLFEIYSEYIFSITCEYSAEGTPFFVGVSETHLTMDKDDVSVGVLILTNLADDAQDSQPNWKVEPGDCGESGEEECKDCFLFEDIRESQIDQGSTLGSNTKGQLWMMYVEKTDKAKVGVEHQHHFDIVCGNVRKPMTITIEAE